MCPCRKHVCTELLQRALDLALDVHHLRQLAGGSHDNTTYVSCSHVYVAYVAHIRTTRVHVVH